MADEILWNDEQKVEHIKKMWKQYGNLATSCIIALMLAILGWQFWQRHQTKQTEQASIAYENLVASIHAAPNTTANLAQQLKQQYPRTPYADFAAFMLAQQAVNQNNYAAAAEQLQWVVDHARSDNLEQLARIRLARVLLAQNKPQDALNILEAKTINIYPGLAAMEMGDAYTALKDVDHARQAYQTALQKLPKQTSVWSLANMKLNDLPASNS